MSFVEHAPSRNSVSDMSDTINCIRISFKKKEDKKSNKNISLTIYIGKNLAEKLGINGGDRLAFFYDDEDNRKWLIKKPLQGSGYKLIDANSAKSRVNYLRMQLMFKIPDFNLSEDDFIIRTVKHELLDGGILINA